MKASFTIAILSCIVGLAVLPTAISGAKILLSMTMVMNTVSQHMLLSSITEPLVDQGHEVVLLAPKNKMIKGLTKGAVTGKIFFENSRSEEEMEAFVSNLNTVAVALSEDSLISGIKRALGLLGMLTEGCQKLWDDPATLRRLQDERFDLIISMPIVGCDGLLAEYLDVPFVVMTPLRRVPVFSEDIYGIPAPSAYIPFTSFMPFTDEMTFLQRTTNVLIRYVAEPFFIGMLTRPIRALQREKGIRPDLSLEQLLGRAQLWFSHSHPAVEFGQPTGHNVVSIGGITVIPPKPLPQDMEDFVQGSGEHGIVVFTLGSVVSSLLDDELTNTLAKVLAELPQRVLWRYKGTKPRDQGNNTLIASWLPQNDLLGHPKTRLLIYHGGINGVYEAAFHGVPLLLMPLAGDQMANAARIKRKGMGFPIDKNVLTEESFRADLKEILENPKYTANAKKISGIMNGDIASNQEKVVHHIDHILKYGGDHLRSRSLEMNFIQRESIDVIVFLLVVFSVALFGLKWFICRCCCGMCRRQEGTTGKSKAD